MPTHDTGASYFSISKVNGLSGGNNSQQGTDGTQLVCACPMANICQVSGPQPVLRLRPGVSAVLFCSWSGQGHSPAHTFRPGAHDQPKAQCLQQCPLPSSWKAKSDRKRRFRHFDQTTGIEKTVCCSWFSRGGSTPCQAGRHRCHQGSARIPRRLGDEGRNYGDSLYRGFHGKSWFRIGQFESIHGFWGTGLLLIGTQFRGD